MYRLILVDDEPQIRKGLVSLIPWDEYGIEVVGEAENGCSALQLVDTLEPDLAIVDIRMPHLDGIGFLQEVRKRSDSPKCIVLSGFDQFDYVREAMRLGARNYLLKPVDPEELKTTISEMIVGLDNEKKQREQFAESIEILRNNTLNRVLNNQIDVRELREKCRLLDITLRCNQMAVVVLRPIAAIGNPLQRKEWVRIMHAFEEILDRYFVVYPMLDEADNIAFILKQTSASYSDEQMRDVFARCLSDFQKKESVKCLGAIGTIAKSHKELPNSYHAAIRAVDFQYMWGNDEFEAAELDVFCAQQGPGVQTNTLVELLQQCDETILQSWIRNYLHQVVPMQHRFNPTLIKFYVIELTTCSIQAAHTCCVTETELKLIKDEIYERTRNAKTVGELEKLIFEMLWKISQQVQHLTLDGYSSRIQYSVQYVNRHYNDSNLSLKTLAHKLEINSAYLGRQFNLETGMFFSDYLNHVRIQRARYLLNTTVLRLAEVAEQVGFTSVSYFSTVYKKITGERPGQARNVPDA